MSAQAVFSGNGDYRQTLVTIFLRGGADGLSLVAPVEDDDYYRARPRIAVPKEKALKLDGPFGLNPQLSALEPAWKEGELAIIHAAGSEDQTRSHFEAQDLMEHGGLTAGGWLGRYLRARPKAGAGALTGVAIGRLLPECLLGAPMAAVMQRLEDFSFGDGAQGFHRELQALYAGETGALGGAARDTFDALGRIEKLRSTAYAPEHGAIYSANDEFAEGLKQLARLIKARVGLEAASIDLGGWDSHFTQQSLIEPLMKRLGEGLAAFRQDLGPTMQEVTVVIMTEFGRRVGENTSFGTDHGRGGVLWVLGGGVKGGRTFGQWPGLRNNILEGPGDVPVVTNYRNVLAPILRRHGLDDAGLDKVFPQFELKPVEMYG